MASKAAPLIAIAALAIAGCDVSQTKPQLNHAQHGHSAAGAALSQPFAMRATPGDLQEPTETPSGASDASRVGGERSLRLYGPGVSRRQQIRI